MGDGAVIEMGKHNELLSNEDGPYARLVAAQRLRETREEVDIGGVTPVGQESCEKAVECSADIEKAAMEEVPLGRRNTSRSLASEIIEQRKAQGLSNQEKVYSMFYVFKRMGRINKGEWKHYLFGTLFAIGKYSLFLGQFWPLTTVCSDRCRLSGFRYYLVYVGCIFRTGRELTFRTSYSSGCHKLLRPYSSGTPPRW